MAGWSCTCSAKRAPGKRSPRGTRLASRPPGLEGVARRAGDVEMTEIPPWRCLLVRTWPENGEPAYHRDQFTVTVTLELVCLRFLDGPHGAGTRRHQRAAPPAAPPREISFTAGRAAITSARHGTATAGVPRPLISAACQAVTAGIGRRLTPGRPQWADVAAWR